MPEPKTPEERVREDEVIGPYVWIGDEWRSANAKAIRLAIASAVAEEREACAREVETLRNLVDYRQLRLGAHATAMHALDRAVSVIRQDGEARKDTPCEDKQQPQHKESN